MVKDIRSKLDSYCQAIDQDIASSRQEGRNRYTYLVLRALYHSVEISYSRCLVPSDRRHAADQHARDIIQITQQLRAKRVVPPAGLRISPQSTAFRSPAARPSAAEPFHPIHPSQGLYFPVYPENIPIPIHSSTLDHLCFNSSCMWLCLLHLCTSAPG